MTTTVKTVTSPPRRGPAVTRLAAALACAGLVTAVTACGGGAGPTAQHQPAAARFLSAYAQPDGRVVRRDQGGDTVSEGQAYGLLLAEATGNHGAFGRIWRWTRDNLQLSDGLFAWRADAAGKIVGRQPASDADLLIAWALLRYQGPGAATWHQDGRRVAGAILAHEVTTGPGNVPVLTAGPWATGRPASLNPSYWSLPAMQGLARLTGDQAWQRMAAAAITLTGQLTQNGRMLPPDWAALTAGGALHPEPAPDGSQPQTQYGPDAQRTVVWFAASCDPKAKALAARWWPLLRPGDHVRALALQPDGAVQDSTPTALSMVASAAAAKAAGDGTATAKLLRQAAGQQHDHPTYYDGAWDALGPALLTAGPLGTC
jgi:endo-1,4-beta-D-glucanase Y